MARPTVKKEVAKEQNVVCDCDQKFDVVFASLEKLYEEQLADAKLKAEKQVFGADRWVTASGFRLSKIRTIITMMEEPASQDGTPIRIPHELDPSPVKRSLNIDEQSVIPIWDLTALALSDLEE